MAGVRNSTQRREVNIGAGMDTSAIATAVQQITGSLKGLTAEIQNISRSTANSIEPMQRSFKKVANTSGLAGASIMGMTGIIQDSNYGIRGMANNIQFVVPLLGQLVVETGSLAGAFKSLWTSLMGPLGVMMVFSTGIAILERYSMRKKEVAEETNKATQAFAEESAEATIMFNHLENLVKSNGSLKDIKRSAKEINEKYNTTLNAEKLTIDEIQKSYTNVISSIKQKISIEAGGKLIKEGIQKQTAAEMELVKLNAKLKTTKDALLENAYFSVDAKQYDVDLQKKLNKDIEEQNKLIQEANNLKQIGAHAAEQARIRLDKLGLFEPEKETKETEKTEKDANRKRVESIKSSQAQIMDLLKPRQNQNEELFNQMLKGSEEGLDFFYFNGKLSMNNYGKGIEDGTRQVGPIIQNSTEFIKSEYQKSFEKLSEQMKAMLQTYVVDVVVSIGDLIGQALVMGGDAFKGGKDDMLKGFADFLGKLGGMMIAFGITLSAFWEGLKNPANAGIVIAAGIAAVVAAGAIKGYLKKQSNSNTIGSMSSSNSSGGGMGSSGYSNNEMYVYSRLDGRDLVLSNQRAVYQQRR
jgi:hypothetical protein